MFWLELLFGVGGAAAITVVGFRKYRSSQPPAYSVLFIGVGLVGLLLTSIHILVQTGSPGSTTVRSLIAGTMALAAFSSVVLAVVRRR